MITNPADPDYHPQDARRAVAVGFMVRDDHPWCRCVRDHGGIVTCRRCGRMRQPGAAPLPEANI